MKRFFVLVGIPAFICLAMLAPPAQAISAFGKQWKKEYAPKDGDEEWYKKAKKANCYVCHVKGHPDKKKANNEYGLEVKKYLEKDDFSKEYIKENPEEAKQKILEGFKKAGEGKSKDEKMFSEKIEAKELPATDWKYEE